ncbi:MAG: hypothetical protein PF508_03835 [Spirochaeta sp.]|jgi:hypothetical protein|nr:hypothetical protein [Spirochaeta sp.]
MKCVHIDVIRYPAFGDAWPIILAYRKGKPVYRKASHRPKRSRKKAA